MRKIILVLGAFLVILLSSCSGPISKETFHSEDSRNKADIVINENDSEITKKAKYVKRKMVDYVSKEAEIYQDVKVKTEEGSFVVFLSATDSTSRASVYHGVGKSILTAYDQVMNVFLADYETRGLTCAWLKADLVCSSKEYSTSGVLKSIGKSSPNGFRYGISFDSNYENALLQMELNANGLIDYENIDFKLKELNDYFAKNGWEALDAIPTKLVTFSTYSVFSDSSNDLFDLSSDYYSGGTRILTDGLTDTVVKDLIYQAGDYLMKTIDENGKFVYGYYGDSGKKIPGYNIIRHAGTIWNLALQYKVTKDERLKTYCKRAIDYLIDYGYIAYDENGDAFLLNLSYRDICVGGNGIFLLALTQYIESFGMDDTYYNLAIALANGIIHRMQDSKTGQFIHELYADYTVKNQFVIVYYDGEAAFGLAKLYGITNESIYLEKAKLALDYCIQNGYEKYASHWMAYTVNEITKYAPSAKYYEFGLKNFEENKADLAAGHSPNHTKTEMLLATFEMYQRMLSSDCIPAYNSKFDSKRFKAILEEKCLQLVNATCYPEVTMYFENPSLVLGGMCIRSDHFRVRNDDVQHTCGAFCLFYLNYSTIQNFIH